MVLGHEASGTVVEIGSEVADVALGDRVVLNWAPACRECWFCRADEPWLCKVAERAGVVTQRGTLAGEPLNVALGVGAFSEEVVVPQSGVVVLGNGIDLDVAALLGCSVLTGVGAVRKTARVQPGQTVAVIGLGGIGLSALAEAKLAGASKIIAVDVAPEKETLARMQGATDFITADASLPTRIRSLTSGRGADHVFECVGRSSTIRTAWESTRRGGECTVIGIGKKSDVVEINALELFHFARTLRSSIGGSCDPEIDIQRLSAEAVSGALDLQSLVTHRVDLEGLAEAFERMEKGVGARSLIILDEAAIKASG